MHSFTLRKYLKSKIVRESSLGTSNANNANNNQNKVNCHISSKLSINKEVFNKLVIGFYNEHFCTKL